MKRCTTTALALAFMAVTLAVAPAQTSKSLLDSNTEPGSINLEKILPKPVRLTVAADSVIYYQGDFQRALGNMAPGTAVQLIAMSETAYKVRGRARHGDVAGWMHMNDLKSSDPKLFEKLKAYAERRKVVDELIQKHQIAIGMTAEEVKASLGTPTRKSSHITDGSREETLEYIVFQYVPQATTGRDQNGNLVQNVVYVKVESGRLSVALKGDAVSDIKETKGNPLGGGGVKIVPIPIIVN
jgi:hypothetical protein